MSSIVLVLLLLIPLSSSDPTTPFLSPNGLGLFPLPIQPIPSTMAPFTFPSVAPPFMYSTANDINTPIVPPPSINFTIDPEALMNVPDIITHWGYPVEVHNVVTDDGYILQLHRIPHGKNNKPVNGTRPLVFLQHGLLCTSSIWLLNLPHQSAGFIFADAGFDVWLGNMRGNVYSKEHVSMLSSNPEFWKFSWEEMARRDLPAMINYALNHTGKQQLYYVGHSQGTLTMFAKLSEDKAFGKKIRKFFALAPVGRMSNVQGMFNYLGKIYEQFNASLANKKPQPTSHLVYRLFGDNEFLSNNIFTRLLTDILCDRAAKNPLCENFIFSVSGPNSNQFNSSRIGIYLAHNPAGTSARNMVHYAQMVKGKRMSAFDRGTEDNIRHYGTPIPPEYNLRSISSPLYLFYSDYDWLANSADVEGFLLHVLPKKALKVVRKLKEFNHNDFLWGLRARKEVYDPIVNTIRLDNRRLDIQRGLRAYFETVRPAHIPEDVRAEFVRHLNSSLEFD